MKPLLKLKPRRNRQPLTRPEMMSRIRARDTECEIVARRAVHALGVRFRKNVADLPGKPDMANKSGKWAIFVHGCFWHGHGCKLSSTPKTNAGYWSPKLQRNRDRDARNEAALEALGFRVLTVWECETRSTGGLEGKIRAFFAI